MTIINQAEIISSQTIHSYIREEKSEYIDIHIDQLNELVGRIASEGEEDMIQYYMMEEMEYDIHLIPKAVGTIDAYLEFEDDMYWIGTIYDDGSVTYLQNVRLTDTRLLDESADYAITPYLSYDNHQEYKFTMHRAMDLIKEYLTS